VSRLNEHFECAVADRCIMSMPYRQTTKRFGAQPSHVMRAIGLIDRQGATRLE